MERTQVSPAVCKRATAVRHVIPAIMRPSSHAPRQYILYCALARAYKQVKVADGGTSN